MFIYNFTIGFFKSTIAALYIMTCWGGKVATYPYKFFFQRQTQYSNVQIVENVKSGGKLTIIQEGDGSNYQKVNNVRVDGDINITQTDRGSTITSTNGSRININGSDISNSTITAANNSTINISGTNIYSNPSNNTVKINNTDLDGEIDIEQGNTGGNNSFELKNCGTIKGDIKVRQGNTTNSDSFSTVDFSNFNFNNNFSSPSLSTAIPKPIEFNYSFNENIVLNITSNNNKFEIHPADNDYITADGPVIHTCAANILNVYAKVGAICKIYLPNKCKLFGLDLNNNNGTIIINAVNAQHLKATLNNDSTQFENCDIDQGLIDTNNSKKINIKNCSIKNILTLKANNSKNINSETTMGAIACSGTLSNFNMKNHYGPLTGNGCSIVKLTINNEKLSNNIILNGFSTSTINLNFKTLPENAWVSSNLSVGKFNGSLLNQKGCKVIKNICDQTVTYNIHNRESSNPGIILNGSTSRVNFNVGSSITDYFHLN